MCRALIVVVLLAGCAASPDASDGGLPDAADVSDLATLPDDLATRLTTDLAAPACQWGGAPGQCAATCGSGNTAKTGSCATGQSCCIITPSTANNPPTPTGYKPMTQAQVTPDMTTWAVAILHDPVTYPMFATTTKVFGALDVLARVEWHPPDFQNSIIHRGVTLYVPN